MVKTSGEAAYNAYCKLRNWKSFDDQDLPTYETLQATKPDIAAGWEAAAFAAQTHLTELEDMRFHMDLDRGQVADLAQKAMDGGIVAAVSSIISLGDQALGASGFVDVLVGEEPAIPVAVIIATGALAAHMRADLAGLGLRINVVPMRFGKRPEVVNG
jgi:hypothetical protein